MKRGETSGARGGADGAASSEAGRETGSAAQPPALGPREGGAAGRSGWAVTGGGQKNAGAAVRDGAKSWFGNPSSIFFTASCQWGFLLGFPTSFQKERSLLVCSTFSFFRLCRRGLKSNWGKRAPPAPPHLHRK